VSANTIAQVDDIVPDRHLVIITVRYMALGHGDRYDRWCASRRCPGLPMPCRAGLAGVMDDMTSTMPRHIGGMAMDRPKQFPGLRLAAHTGTGQSAGPSRASRACSSLVSDSTAAVKESTSLSRNSSSFWCSNSISSSALTLI